MAVLEMLNNMQNLQQMLTELKANPLAFAAKNRYSIPEGMNDPSQITQYLVNTGQISQDRINKVMTNPILRMFGGR